MTSKQRKSVLRWTWVKLWECGGKYLGHSDWPMRDLAPHAMMPRDGFNEPCPNGSFWAIATFEVPA